MSCLRLAEIMTDLSHDSVNRFLLRENYTPKDSGRWKHGDYVVIISAGAKLNRQNDKQKYGAFTINIMNEVTDVLTLIGGKILPEKI